MGKTVLEWVPSSVRWLIRPALFGSIGLHVLLLLAPLPQNAALETSAPEDEPSQVSLTRLPTQPSPTPKSIAPPKPSPIASPQALRPSPSLVRPLSQRPILRPSVQLQAPPTAQPSAQPSAQPKLPAAEVAVATPTPSITPAAEPVPPPAIPFADIPVLAGTQTGCFGLGTCHQIEGSNFRTAGQTLQEQLQTQGYSVKQRDDIEETGREVYEITKGNETRYLNVLSSNLGTTVYLVTTQPISLNQLEDSESLKSELEGILDRFPSTNTANATQFALPEAFFAGVTARPETGGKLRLVPNNSPDQFLGSLESQLQAQSFNMTEAGGYGGGRLYEVTKGPYTGYLSLVPTADRTSTIVVLWTNLPS